MPPGLLRWSVDDAGARIADGNRASPALDRAFVQRRQSVSGVRVTLQRITWSWNGASIDQPSQFGLLFGGEFWHGTRRLAIVQAAHALDVVACTQSRNVCRSMPQVSAAVLRSDPSSTSARASTPRRTTIPLTAGSRRRSDAAISSIRTLP